jgi:Fic family protein
VEAFLVRYQFEAIHPFMDGNGRVGRLLLSVVIAEWCGLSNQWLYMSAYFDRNKDEYIDRLFAVSTVGAWTEWIRFCLQGVVEQATDAIRRCDQLISLHQEYHERIKVAAGSLRLSSIVDDLFVRPPVVTVTSVRDRYKVTYPTARSDLRMLEGMGILVRMKGASRISYFCPAVFG